MDLSIIIVNHNTKELTKQAISSVFTHTKGISFELIVVDNSDIMSQRLDGKLKYPDVKIIFADNKGFGNACNTAAKLAASDIFLFLNSDTFFEDDSISRCVEYIKSHKDIGILGTKTVLSSGEFDHSCKRGFPTPASSLYYFMGLDRKFPNNKKFGRYHQTFLSTGKINEVDAVSGTCMFCRKEVFDSILGFDEDFFMYGEDLDICYRVKQAGFKVIYFPLAHVVHIKGQSGLNVNSKNTTMHFYNAMKIFYNKHYRKKYNKFLTSAVMLAIDLKCKLSLFKLK